MATAVLPPLLPLCTPRRMRSASPSAMAGVTSRKARGWRKASEAKRRESRWLQKLATLKDTDPVAAVLEEQVHLAEKAEQLRKAEALAAKTAETRRANKRVGKLGARRLAGARPSGPRELALPKRTAEGASPARARHAALPAGGRARRVSVSAALTAFTCDSGGALRAAEGVLARRQQGHREVSQGAPGARGVGAGAPGGCR